jgi:hypothetical protein
VDDFLFGIAGTKSLVILVKKRVIQFVKSDLKLELVGGEVVHTSSGKVSFLGLEISGSYNPKFSWRFSKALGKRQRVARRFIMQKRVKEDRILKALQLSLKKSIKTNLYANVNASFKLKLKFQAIKKHILFDNKFTCSSITSYKEFIKRIYFSHTFGATLYR